MSRKPIKDWEAIERLIEKLLGKHDFKARPQSHRQNNCKRVLEEEFELEGRTIPSGTQCVIFRPPKQDGSLRRRDRGDTICVFFLEGYHLIVYRDRTLVEKRLPHNIMPEYALV